MVKNFVHMNCSKDTKQLIEEKCVEIFLKNNPEFRKVNITHDIILERIARYYIES